MSPDFGWEEGGKKETRASNADMLVLLFSRKKGEKKTGEVSNMALFGYASGDEKKKRETVGERKPKSRFGAQEEKARATISPRAQTLGKKKERGGMKERD